jgi:hypothetical protein
VRNLIEAASSPKWVDRQEPALSQGMIGTFSSSSVVPLNAKPNTLDSCREFANQIKTSCMKKPMSGESFDYTQPYKVVARFGEEEFDVENCYAIPSLTLGDPGQPLTVHSQYVGDEIGVAQSSSPVNFEIEKSADSSCADFTQIFNAPASASGEVTITPTASDEGKTLCYRSRVKGASGYSDWAYLTVEIPGHCDLLSESGEAPGELLQNFKSGPMANLSECSKAVNEVSCIDLQNNGIIPTTRDTAWTPIFAGVEHRELGRVCPAWEVKEPDGSFHVTEGQSCRIIAVDQGLLGTNFHAIRSGGLPAVVVPVSSGLGSVRLPGFDTLNRCREWGSEWLKKDDVCAISREVLDSNGDAYWLSETSGFDVVMEMTLASGLVREKVISCLPPVQLTLDHAPCTPRVTWQASGVGEKMQAVVSGSNGKQFTITLSGESGTALLDDWIRANGQYSPNEFTSDTISVSIGTSTASLAYLNSSDSCKAGTALSPPKIETHYEECGSILSWAGDGNPKTSFEITIANGLGETQYEGVLEGPAGSAKIASWVGESKSGLNIQVRARLDDQVSEWVSLNDVSFADPSCPDAPKVSIPDFKLGYEKCSGIIMTEASAPFVELEATDEKGKVFTQVLSVTKPAISLKTLMGNLPSGIGIYRLRAIQDGYYSEMSAPQFWNPIDPSCGMGGLSASK